MSRRSFHQSEYTALCHANIELCVAQNETEGARHWLRTWEDVAPDDERVMYWHARLEPGWLGRLFRQQKKPGSPNAIHVVQHLQAAEISEFLTGRLESI